MALGTWFLKRKNLHNDGISRSISTFVVGNEKSLDQNNVFYLTSDKSLLYTKVDGDYSVLLGGNWRFELIVNSTTGICEKIQCFLDELEVNYASLELPKTQLKDLYYTSNEPLSKNEGCHYSPFYSMITWDRDKHILCLGYPHSNGEAIEFTNKTIAIVENGQLVCVYLVLDDISKEIDTKLF